MGGNYQRICKNKSVIDIFCIRWRIYNEQKFDQISNVPVTKVLTKTSLKKNYNFLLVRRLHPFCPNSTKYLFSFIGGILRWIAFWTIKIDPQGDEICHFENFDFVWENQIYNIFKLMKLTNIFLGFVRPFVSSHFGSKNLNYFKFCTDLFRTLLILGLSIGILGSF